MSLIFLGGLNGVGKTAITKKCSSNTSIEVIQGSQELMKQLGISAGDYKKLQRISVAKKRRATEEIFKNLKAKSTSEGCNIIVSGHYVKILNGQISVSYGSWYDYCSKFVLIIASPREILDRINLDKANNVRTQRNLFGSRISPGSKLKFLERAQSISRKVFQKAANSHEAPSLCIRNSDGKIKEAVSQLIKFINKE